ncbi:unnamed protein product [Phytophthora fragariaefolia]|uniref:Unnamed protein product n=1 Tax=Phytophthora fragariaefolia TaxID=1490495 RepID=A0A9W7CL83_9STRA|nr:unnamed protein product [Phytophthora fragariaefolia]
MTTTALPCHPKAGRKRAAPTAKKQRKSRLKFDFKYEQLANYFHMSQRDAAKCLGVATITLKRCCKRECFNWPYRANKYKSGTRQVLSAKGLAFKQLPLHCIDENEFERVGETEHESSECDTDTESLEDDEQLKADYGAILLAFRKSPIGICGV